MRRLTMFAAVVASAALVVTALAAPAGAGVATKTSKFCKAVANVGSDVSNDSSSGSTAGLKKTANQLKKAADSAPGKVKSSMNTLASKFQSVANAKGKIAQAENVRAALLFVARREAPLGIVYQTDANSDKGVQVVGTFPDDTHPPIIYPIAVVAASTNPGAPGYVAFLKSPTARQIFEKQGFTVLQ